MVYNQYKDGNGQNNGQYCKYFVSHISNGYIKFPESAAI